jgi:hypothetical protein
MDGSKIRKDLAVPNNYRYYKTDTDTTQGQQDFLIKGTKKEVESDLLSCVAPVTVGSVSKNNAFSISFLVKKSKEFWNKSIPN